MLKLFHKRKSSSQAELFGVPAPDPFKNPLVETHPGQLRQWAAGLPFANPQQLAEAVIKSLSRLNRFPGPVKRREELMQVYLHPVARLCHGSPEQKNSLPIRLKRQLIMEMIYGYLHLINSYLPERSSEKSRSRLAGFIYLATKFLALEYLFACEEYDCRTHTARKELMRLFSLAEDINLHEAPQDDPDQPSASIAHQTKLCLLLTLLDPCHLQKGESAIAFDYLNQFASKARFVALDASVDASGHYVIDRLGEVPSQQLNPDGIEGLTASRFCLLDIIPVSQILHKHLRLIEKKNANKPPELKALDSKTAASLVRRILKAWHIRLQRDSERHETSGQVKLSLGLPLAHHQLSTSGDSITSVEAGQDAFSITPQSYLLSGQADQSRTLDSWRSNQSRSGVALLLNLPLANPPEVGEIVLLAKPQNKKREEMKLGIIRRALLREDSILELGLQFINGRIVPISIQALDEADGEQAANLPALYIDLGSIERSSLLIPKDLLKIGQEYRVEEMIPAPVISPIHLSESTARFERYRIARA